MKGNYDSDYYKLYYHDTGLLIASLDEEAQEDLRANIGYKNIGWNGQFYTFPYFLTFLLKRFLKER